MSETVFLTDASSPVFPVCFSTRGGGGGGGGGGAEEEQVGSRAPLGSC